MSKESKTISIECPLCKNGPHNYLLTPTISKVASFMGNSQQNSPHKRTFIQLFTCPATNERFQASITLSEKAGNRIKSIQISAG